MVYCAVANKTRHTYVLLQVQITIMLRVATR
jgi:hypothetical protein